MALDFVGNQAYYLACSEIALNFSGAHKPMRAASQSTYVLYTALECDPENVLNLGDKALNSTRKRARMG
jgi:hypothetical protein